MSELTAVHLLATLALAAGCGASPPPPTANTSPVTKRSNASPEAPRASSTTGTSASPAPAQLGVSRIEPRRGDAAGGTYVVIKGGGFLRGGPRRLRVSFGGTPGTFIRFQSDSEIIVQAPGGRPGETVDVELVFDPGGTVILGDSFTFVSRDDEPSDPP